MMGKSTAWYPESRLVVADVLAPHLSCQQLKDALAFVTVFPLEEQCFAALVELARFQSPETRDETAKRGLAMARGIGHERHKVRAVAALAPILPADLVSEAFEIVASIEHPWWMVRAMGALAPFLPTALLPAVLPAIPGGAHGVGLDYAVRTMPRLFERLAIEGCTAVIDGLLPRLEGASNWSHSVCEHLSILALYLSSDQARRAWQIADTLWGSSRAEALSALVCRLPADEQGSAVDEVLAAFTPDAFSPERDAKILGRLARAAPTQRLIQALRDLLASRAARSALKDRFLEELSPGLPETLIEEAFQYALSTEEVDVNARALAKLAPRLSGALLTQAISYVSEQTGWHLQRTVALAALARQLPPQDRELVLASPVLKHALSAPSWSYHGRVLIDLIPHLPERLRPQAVDAQMNEARQELSWRKEFDNSIGLLPALLPVLRATELEQLYARLGETGNSRPRAAALAAVLRHTGKRHADTVFKDGRPIHHQWPLDVDRAGFLELLALRHGGFIKAVGMRLLMKSSRLSSMSSAGGPDPTTWGPMGRPGRWFVRFRPARSRIRTPEYWGIEWAPVKVATNAVVGECAPRRRTTRAGTCIPRREESWRALIRTRRQTCGIRHRTLHIYPRNSSQSRTDVP